MVKPSGFIKKNWAPCFSSARYRNDLDSKWYELCHCCAGLMPIQDLTLGLLPVTPMTGQQTAKRKLRWRNRQTIFAGGYFRGKIFSREDIFARRYFRGKIFSREDIFAWTVYSRKYLLAKIFQIHFSRNFLPAKIKCYTVGLRGKRKRHAAAACGCGMRYANDLIPYIYVYPCVCTLFSCLIERKHPNMTSYSRISQLPPSDFVPFAAWIHWPIYLLDKAFTQRSKRWHAGSGSDVLCTNWALPWPCPALNVDYK